jgi:hypothetical protein
MALATHIGHHTDTDRLIEIVVVVATSMVSMPSLLTCCGYVQN